MASRRRRRAPPGAQGEQGPAPGRALRLEVGLTLLEVARGHDGLFRGEPEPCLVVGAWAVRPGGRVATLTRGVLRVPARRQLRPGLHPVSTGEDTPTLPLARASVSSDPAALLLVLVIGLEEDGPAGVERVYAALERGSELAVWWEGATVPEPQPLSALSAAPAGPLAGESVRVVDGTGELADTVAPGTWVGASLLRVPLARRSAAETVRCHLALTGAANDWTALVDVSLR